MPTYDFKCPQGHLFECFRSISAHEADPHPHCPHEGCGLPGSRVLISMPYINNTEVMILDYPGSKRLKAGYVGDYVDPGVKKVSVGYGGVLNPRTAPYDPIADAIDIKGTRGPGPGANPGPRRR